MPTKTNQIAWISALGLTLTLFSGSILWSAQPHTAPASVLQLLNQHSTTPVGNLLTESVYALSPFQQVSFLRTSTARLSNKNTVELGSGMAWLSNLAAGERAELRDSRIAAVSHGGAIWLSSKPESSVVTAISHPLEITLAPEKPAEFVLPAGAVATLTPDTLAELATLTNALERQKLWFSLLQVADLSTSEPRAQQALDNQNIGKLLAATADTNSAESQSQWWQSLVVLPAAEARLAQKTAAQELPRLLAGNTESIGLFTKSQLASLAPLTRLIITPTLNEKAARQIRQSFLAAQAVQTAAGLQPLPKYVASWQANKTDSPDRLTRSGELWQLLSASSDKNQTALWKKYTNLLPGQKATADDLEAALSEGVVLTAHFASQANHGALELAAQNLQQLTQIAANKVAPTVLAAVQTQATQILVAATLPAAPAVAELHGSAAAVSRHIIARPGHATPKFAASVLENPASTQPAARALN